MRELTKSGLKAVLLIVLLGSVSYFFFPSRTKSFYVDDISIYADGKVVFLDGFDSGSLEVVGGWRSISYSSDEYPNFRTAELQRDFYRSPFYALVLHQSGKFVAHAFHDISIEAGWKTVNYSAWVMVPEMEPLYSTEQRVLPNGTIEEYRCPISIFTDLVLYSGSSFSNLAGGVYLESFENNTCRTHVWLFINYQETEEQNMTTGGLVHNYTVTCIPYQWHMMSILVNSVSEHVQLFFDRKLVAQLPLNVTLFKTFNDISVWGWIP
jgi:hypothetical protein